MLLSLFWEGHTESNREVQAICIQGGLTGDVSPVAMSSRRCYLIDKVIFYVAKLAEFAAFF